MNDTILRVENITKIYPNGIVANHDVNFELKKGEIHALIGENGAGKSTLMKILFGIEIPEEGKIILNEKELKLKNSKDAIENGIGMVHQHFMLVGSLTVAQNISLGNEPIKNKLFLNSDKINSVAEELSRKYKFKVDVTKKVDDVSVGVKQKVEIMKALHRGAKILILDEPTAVLTPQETVELFQELKVLKEEGHTIVFISHKLNEIMQISDRVTIMKHGTTVGTFNINETSPQHISKIMVGRDVKLSVDKDIAKPRETVLSLNNINLTNNLGKKVLDNVSLKLNGGVILGVAGVEGNGQAELAKVLTGNLVPDSGEFILNNKDVSSENINALRKLGVSYIPEDRMTNGCSKAESIEDNIIIDKLEKFTDKSNVFIDKKRTKKYANEKIEEFEIVCKSASTVVGMLSGGNIQKVVAAREFSYDSCLLIAEQPTRGIDAGASEIIRNKIVTLRDAGNAVLLISADLNEILELSDSVVVMHNGKINAYFEDSKNLTEEELGYYMLGVKHQEFIESEEEVHEKFKIK